MIWHRSVGILSYGPGIRVVLLADQGIVDFYYSLVPKHVGLAKQAYEAHVSVVRKEKPTNTREWGKYDGEEAEFEYMGVVKNDETYFWLPVRSHRLMEVRMDLGLDPFPPWRNSYHLTIGNVKHVLKRRSDNGDW